MTEETCACPVCNAMVNLGHCRTAFALMMTPEEFWLHGYFAGMATTGLIDPLVCAMYAEEAMARASLEKKHEPEKKNARALAS